MVWKKNEYDFIIVGLLDKKKIWDISNLHAGFVINTERYSRKIESDIEYVTSYVLENVPRHLRLGVLFVR